MEDFLIFVLMVVGVMFVMAPLGVFVWIGVPTEVLLFKEGYWPFSILLLVLYYTGTFWLLMRVLKVERQWKIGAAIFGIWLVGLYGFLQVVNKVVARFS